MTAVEVLVVVVGLAAGYWMVADLFKGNPAGRAETGPPADSPGAGEGIAGNWFRILDVPEDASREEITMAYNRKIRQYHPDKVAQMGVEIREIAESKSKEINAAYDYGIGRARR